MKVKTKIISDKYRDNRGGYSRIVEISCKECGNFLFYYQKDGSGPLKRLYLDRIIDYKPRFNSKGYVFCKCGACLGFNEPYKKEGNRPAIRVAAEAVTHKVMSIK
jgi:hypothetical protein